MRRKRMVHISGWFRDDFSGITTRELSNGRKELSWIWKHVKCGKRNKGKHCWWDSLSLLPWWSSKQHSLSGVPLPLFVWLPPPSPPSHGGCHGAPGNVAADCKLRGRQCRPRVMRCGNAATGITRVGTAAARRCGQEGRRGALLHESREPAAGAASDFGASCGRTQRSAASAPGARHSSLGMDGVTRREGCWAKPVTRAHAASVSLRTENKGGQTNSRGRKCPAGERPHPEDILYLHIPTLFQAKN